MRTRLFHSLLRIEQVEKVVPGDIGKALEEDWTAARFYGQYAHELHAWKDRFYWRQHLGLN